MPDGAKVVYHVVTRGSPYIFGKKIIFLQAKQHQKWKIISSTSYIIMEGNRK